MKVRTNEDIGFQPEVCLVIYLEIKSIQADDRCMISLRFYYEGTFVFIYLEREFDNLLD